MPLGGALPENKNLANLSAAIESIPSGGVIGYGTYGELQKAIRAGTAREKFPVGTEIPDTFYGNNNPAIVMHYGKVLDKVGGEHDGAWLMFKYVTNSTYKWADGDTSSYLGSSLRSVCNDFFSAQCSDELRSALQEFQISCYDLNSNSYVSDAVYFCPPSVSQLMGTAYLDEGEAWDYIKVRTGFKVPSNEANSGRVLYTFFNGAERAVEAWTRTPESLGQATGVYTSGQLVRRSKISKESIPISFALF